MSSKNIIISGTGCALADFLYTNISFTAPSFLKYLSKRTGDGGLSPGRLVFTEELENFAGLPYSVILKEIVNGNSSSSFNIGGPGLVSLIHAAQMLDKDKFEVRFYGQAGKDETAKKIIDLLRNTPLDISNYKTGSDKPTSFTDVFSDPFYDNGHGERTFVNNIGSSWDFSPGQIPSDFYNSDIVCFGGTALVPHIHDSLTNLLKEAKSKNCITVVNTVYDFRNEKTNPEEKWPLGQTNESFKFIDLLIMDREEALKISGESSIELASTWFQSKNVSSFVITNGSGKIFAWSNGKLFSGTSAIILPVSALVANDMERDGDTTGCGDNFAGGMIASLAEQLLNSSPGMLDFFKALSWAIASGGYACYYTGGTYFEKFPREKKDKVSDIQKAYVGQIKEDNLYGLKIPDN